MRIAMYQPDIPQNVGAMMRLAACTGVGLDIIEPCGFPWNERKIQQAAMDYLTLVNYVRHPSWQIFKEQARGRIILLSTKADGPYYDFSFDETDILLMGRESEGAPQEIHEAADARIVIPMQEGARSLNIVNSASMVLGEALRQTDWSAK